MSSNASKPPPDPRSLVRRLCLFKGLSAILAAGLVAATFFLYKSNQSSQRPFQETTPPGFDEGAPHVEQVREIVNPLRYTFVNTLMDPKVRLTLDFERGLWTLSHMHTFNPDGTVALAGGNTGICGDLAAYTYEKLLPIFESRYQLRFIRAAESGYFPAPLNTHFVIGVIDSGVEPPKVYVLDPSFHRYGPLDQFDDYLFFEYLHDMAFVKRRDTANVEIVNRALPMLIEKDFKMSLIVTTENEKFDRLNFAISILLTHRNEYMPKTVYQVGRADGRKKISEKERLAALVRGFPEYKMLCDRINQLFDEAILTGKAPSGGN